MNILPRKLNNREKTLAAAFAAVILLLFYQQIISKPLRRELSQLRFNKIKLTKKLRETQESFPNIESQVDKIERLQSEGNLLVDQIKGIERSLMSKEDIPRLLGAINRLGQDVNIVSIKQRIEESPEVSKLYIEVIYTSPFQLSIHYLNNIDSTLDFLRIEKLDFSRGDKNVLNEITCVVLFSTILEPQAPRKTFQVDPQANKLTVKNDLFFGAGHKIASQTTNIDLKLEGVTYSPKNPIAIINGEIYKLNADIEGFTLERIFPDRVVLRKDGQEYILELE